MPKENIDTLHGRVVIGWNKGQQAQVGVSSGATFEVDGEEFDTLYTTLTQREEFNRAIRALRSARDSVCGKDA